MKDEDGFGGQAGAGAHGRSAAAGAGVVSAEDEAEVSMRKRRGTGNIFRIEGGSLTLAAQFQLVRDSNQFSTASSTSHSDICGGCAGR